MVVVDCLTLWLSNLLLRDEGEERILERVDALAALLARRLRHTVLVTNEVGMSVVPHSRSVAASATSPASLTSASRARPTSSTSACWARCCACGRPL